MSIAGIDVSQWQGSISWAAVADPAQGLAFAVTKATEGNGFTDPTFLANITAIRSTRLIPGHYHYARPDLGNTPQAEAEWFLSQAGWRQGEIIQLDFEAPAASGDLAAWALTWLDHVATATGASPFFYSYRSYIDPRGGQDFAALAAKYPLWIAGVTGDPQPPWTTTAIWQDAGQQHLVAGISGAVDYDVFFGGRDQLSAYAGAPGGISMADAASLEQQITDLRGVVGTIYNAEYWSDTGIVDKDVLAQGGVLAALHDQVAALATPNQDALNAAVVAALGPTLKPLADQLATMNATLARIEAALKAA